MRRDARLNKTWRTGKWENTMLTDDISALNEQFAIGEHIAFVEGPGGLPLAEIRNHDGEAVVALQGAHVVTYQPRGQAPVLFLSRGAVYRAGKAIRGGIPVCWPWFAQHPADPSKPMHGFARTAMWQVSATGVIEDATELRLALVDSDDTLALWPHAFALELAVTVGARLQVELIARNTGAEPFTCGGALHSYFHTGDVRDIAIHGLDGCTYIDKVDGGGQKTQRGPITIDAETDRIYLDTIADCVIDDPNLGRRIRVAKSGSHTTVVWNPWVERAAQIADFSPEEYLSMICVETTNAAEDTIVVPPGGEHRLLATIEAQS
jgi:glucose-6-phosphate 1-epimerase